MRPPTAAGNRTAAQAARDAWPLTIYYDASCPLCRSEIAMLAARAPAGCLALVDCSAAEFADTACAAAGITRADLMARIHARDARGHWLRGVDVFAAAYGAAGLDLLARLFGSRRLRPLLVRLYPWIADHRQLLSRLGLAGALGYLAPGGASASSCVTKRCASGQARDIPGLTRHRRSG